MKKTLTILVTLLMIVAMLSSCATSTTQATSQATDGTTTASGTTTAATTTVSTEKVTVTMATVTGHGQYLEIAKKYMAEFPNVTIDITEYPSTEFQAVNRAKLSAGDAYDIFALFNNEIRPFAEAGYLEDLSDLAAVGRLLNGVAESRTVDGKVVAIPAELQFCPVFYNKTLFAANGWSIPTTFDEFLGLIKAIKAKGTLPMSIGFKDGWPQQFLTLASILPTVQQNVDRDWFAKRASNEITFATSPGWVESFERYLEIVDSGAFSENALSTSDEQALKMFVNSESAMYQQGTWSLPAILQSMPEGFDFGAFPMPGNRGSEEACVGGSVSADYAVWSESKVKDEAKKFLDYMYSAENNLFFNTGKGPSSFKDVAVPLHDSITQYLDLTKDMKMYDWVVYDYMGMPPSTLPTMCKQFETALIPDLRQTPQQMAEAMDKDWADNYTAQ